MVSLEDYLHSSGKYPDRQGNAEVVINATQLLSRVNALLAKLGRTAKVSSGYRTWTSHCATYDAINAKRTAEGKSKLYVPTGSGHLNGKAVDLEDADGTLDAAITDELLAEFDLYREDPAKTSNWTHLDTIVRKSRTFKV